MPTNKYKIGATRKSAVLLSVYCFRGEGDRLRGGERRRDGEGERRRDGGDRRREGEGERRLGNS